MAMNLHSAAKLLFPGEVIDDRFFRNLNRLQLKKMYRSLIFDNHPDRAVHIGINRTLLTERFKSITEAYHLLHDHLETPPDFTTPRKSKRWWHRDGSDPAGSKKSSSSADSSRNWKQSGSTAGEGESNPFRRGKSRSRYFPDYELMFGQYLYHSGYINLQELVSALGWQRRQRPPLGELARTWGILNFQDIIMTLKAKKGSEKFADCALRIGLMTPLQHRALLYRQQKMQRPLGDYFLEKKNIGQEELYELLNGMKNHNMRIRYEKSRGHFRQTS